MKKRFITPAATEGILCIVMKNKTISDISKMKEIGDKFAIFVCI